MKKTFTRTLNRNGVFGHKIDEALSLFSMSDPHKTIKKMRISLKIIE
jgi:hypothetical protein